MELPSLNARELLRAHCDVLRELRRRDIIRSANNPASDLAELLFCRAFPSWQREKNSKAGYDAIDPRGVRFQIKSRRLDRRDTSRQLSAIRNFENDPFDLLAGVLFDENFGIYRAALIPFAVVKERAKRSDHTNSWKFMLTDDVWRVRSVSDVSDKVLKALASL